MTGTGIDVSLVVVAHDQGAALHGTIESVRRTSACAAAAGWVVEHLVVEGPDRSRSTVEYLERLGPAWRVVDAGHGRGERRRAGAAASAGRYVAMLDAPDLWGETFVARALALAREPLSPPTVWRPEGVVSTGAHFYLDYARHQLLWQPDIRGGRDAASLLFACPYAATFVAARSLLLDVPFPDEDAARGWTDVDWWWTCNVAGHGVPHRVVPATFCYERDIPGRATPIAGQSAGRPGPGPLARLTPG